jgi:3-hydroxyisobutyrate dehydrogenase-like beta-hydroxyacid dehydrogenase
MKIGTVGLGAMGAPMTRNLAVEGDEILCFDLDERKIHSVVGNNIRAVSDVGALAKECELVVVMITDDVALRSVVFGERGILSVPFKGCVVDLSTTSVSLARECESAVAKHGGVFLDGAVIGGGAPAAKAGTSPIVVSGDETSFERYKSRLARLGNCDFVGATGNAKIVKVINNMLVGIFTAANAEALSLGMAAGLDLKSLVGGLEGGSGESVVLKSYMGKYAKEGVYGDGLIGHSLMAKDLTLACELGSETSSPVVFAEVARQFYMWAGAALGQDKMFPSVFELFRRDMNEMDALSTA